LSIKTLENTEESIKNRKFQKNLQQDEEKHNTLYVKYTNKDGRG